MLKLNHEKIGELHVITLSGILNADTSPGFESMLAPLCRGPRPLLLIHLPELTYISSAGIGCFIGVIKGVRSRGGDIRFSEMDRKVRRVFRLLDMDDFFHFYDSRGEGIASFGDGGGRGAEPPPSQESASPPPEAAPSST